VRTTRVAENLLPSRRVLERDGFPAGVPSWIDTHQADPEAASAFYTGIFAWQFADRWPAGRDARYLVASLDGKEVAAIGSADPGAGEPPAWTTYIGVDDADEATARVRAAGGTVLSAPTDLPGAGRAATCADPSGAVFGLWEPGAIKGAQAVNVPGAWNFSELYTDDVDAATRFYATLFGWQVDEVDMGAMSGHMVRLPGYADFLEQFDPDIRKRHADFGAPPGFSECVAWILPLREGDAPHWNVTFTIADADAVAARARALGGTVVVGPFDVAPVRSTVIRDPQGAQFTANGFNPG
jgi:predicted enzyme related to lactoylglutathione lyase